jgi:hypothetical protein
MVAEVTEFLGNFGTVRPANTNESVASNGKQVLMLWQLRCNILGESRRDARWPGGEVDRFGMAP